MWKAYGQCAEAWDWYVGWLDVESRVDSRYGIHQYDTGFGEIVEVTNHGQPGLGIMEIDATRFDDPDFRIVDMFHVDTNTDRSCIQEGGFRDQQYRKIWEWSAIKWLRKLVDEQTKFENSAEVVIVQPSMKGYCLRIEGTNTYYEITHAEILGDMFNIRRILNIMHAANGIDVNERPALFMDASLYRRQSIMLHATRLMASSFKKRKRTSETEGASSIEKTSMRVKDRTRKVPEPGVVIAEINAHQRNGRPQIL